MAKRKAVKKRSVQSRGSSKKSSSSDKWHAVPLKGSFMVMAILGFFISAYIIFPRSINFGVASMIVFAAMFLAALVSMTKAPVVLK